MMKNHIGAALLLAATTPVLAESEFDLPAEALLDDLPVVLTVSRIPQRPAELPASVTVIDRNLITASGARDVPDLLRLVAGFQVGHDNGEGVRTTVTYHGNSDNFARRMQVLVDGRSVYNPATGGVDWQDLPVALEDIGRIEVTRGPNGVTYGANAFLGVINIITRDPTEQPGNHLTLRHGENSDDRVYLRHGVVKGDFALRLSGFMNDDRGFSDLSPGAETREVNDDQRTGFINARADWRAGINDYLTLDVGFGSGDRQRGSDDDPLDPTRGRDVDYDHQQLRWQHVMSSEEEVKLNLYRTHNRMQDRFLSPALSELLGVPSAAVPLLIGLPDQSVVVDNNVEYERTNLELEHHLSPHPGWRVVWGAEARRDRIRGAGYFGTSAWEKSDLYRLFMNHELTPAERWVINIGAMAEKSDITDTRFSPRAAINYRFAPDHFVRTSFTRAYRTPALFEAKANYAARLEDGNALDILYVSPTIPDPERIDAVELALGGSLEGRRVSYELKLFSERITDAITVVEDNAYADPYNQRAWIITNAGSARTEGVEAQLRLEPSRDTLISFAISHARSSGRVLDEINVEDSADGREWRNTDDSVPFTTLSLLASNRFTEQFRSSLGLYHVTDMQFIGPGDPTGGYTAVDLDLAFQLHEGSTRSELGLTLRNLLGEYFDFRNWVYQERAAYLRLGLEF